MRHGLIEAFIKPGTRNRKRRVYRSVRFQGCEIARFMKMHLSRIDGTRSFSPRLLR
jgi:hypothetical protein